MYRYNYVFLTARIVCTSVTSVILNDGLTCGCHCRSPFTFTVVIWCAFLAGLVWRADIVYRTPGPQCSKMLPKNRERLEWISQQSQQCCTLATSKRILPFFMHGAVSIDKKANLKPGLTQGAVRLLL